MTPSLKHERPTGRPRGEPLAYRIYRFPPALQGGLRAFFTQQPRRCPSRPPQNAVRKTPKLPTFTQTPAGTPRTTHHRASPDSRHGAPARANASRKSVLSLAQSVVSDGSARAHFWAPGVALAPLARRGIIARGGELSWDEADELLSLECVPAPPRARSPTAPKVNNPKRTSTRVWDERPRRC